MKKRVFIPSKEKLRAYARGEIDFEEAGLHNVYRCGIRRCPQCAARDKACWEEEGRRRGWLK